MSDLILVNGEACLEYVNKPLGFAYNRRFSDEDITGQDGLYTSYVEGSEDFICLSDIEQHYSPTLFKIAHDTNKRICGVVTNNYSDGGKRVVLYGNETLNFSRDSAKSIRLLLSISCRQLYYYPTPLGNLEKKDYNVYPVIESANVPLDRSECWASLSDTNNNTYVGFDELLDYKPTFHNTDIIQNTFPPEKKVFKYQGNDISSNKFVITNNKNNTLVFGENAIKSNLLFLYGANDKQNPLYCISGNVYDYMAYVSQSFASLCPHSFMNSAYLGRWTMQMGTIMPTYNGCCIPFNLILTNSEQFALEYINNGTLPPDAYLYPLDFDNLPKYDDPVPTGDTPEDYDDDNTPDDDTRDFDPMPPENPTFTVNQLSNYNWYWLDVSQWSGFINWFWNDIGNYNDFDDIIAKVKGLYNDLASSVIMCRYYPVEVGWIGGTGNQSNIKIGMIEKDGLVDTLANNALRVQDIGHVHIGGKYKSFMDMSPYSQLSLYLPWHGFIDIDVNLFTGHDLYVKALYDYMSGTIQYYIYYDNEIPVNTILCKMAMDIPITLQTKNDRDSAIFNNVSSTIGGLVGAGVGIASGNPIGMVMGVTQGIGAINSSNASAPMRLMGNVGESGAYLGCQYCAIVVRRPTIQPSDGNSQTSIAKGLGTWKHNVGMLCGYGYTLSNLKGQGFTVCHTPRIDFKNTAPMQTEVDEIYSYLEKGVIL